MAELVPPSVSQTGHRSRYEELVATGVIRPALEDGDPLEGWPDIKLPAGTAADLINIDVAKRRAPTRRATRRSRREVRTAPDVLLSTLYIESSALVAALLEPTLVTIVTRDGRVRDNARALGYATE